MLTNNEFKQLSSFINLFDGALEQHGRNITSSEIIFLLRNFTETKNNEVTKDDKAL